MAMKGKAQQDMLVGIEHVYYELPGMAHEWQTWRRNLCQFAPLLFRNQ